MQRYILRRIGQAIITLFILGLVVFLSVRVVGDPGVVLLGIQATAKEHEQLEKNLGLHDPLPVQFGRFLYDVVRGNFGSSWMTGRPARDMILERFPATLGPASASC